MLGFVPQPAYSKIIILKAVKMQQIEKIPGTDRKLLCQKRSITCTGKNLDDFRNAVLIF